MVARGGGGGGEGGGGGGRRRAGSCAGVWSVGIARAGRDSSSVHRGILMFVQRSLVFKNATAFAATELGAMAGNHVVSFQVMLVRENRVAGFADEFGHVNARLLMV